MKKKIRIKKKNLENQLHQPPEPVGGTPILSSAGKTSIFISPILDGHA